MPQLNIVISDMKYRHGIECKNTIKLAGGINNSIFKITTVDGENLVLKIFPDTQKQCKDRYHRELEFLRYLQLIHNNEAPKLIAHSQFPRYLIMNWIPGSKIKSIGTNHLDKIVQFSREINSSRDNVSCLPWASDALHSRESIANSVSNRLKEFEEVEQETELEKEVKHWIDNTLLGYIKKNIDLIYDSKLIDSWGDISSGIIASQSDVGIHNCLEYKDKLYFLDFEFAGNDDISKFACDWVVQPNNPFSERQEEYFLNQISRAFSHIPASWKNRYMSIKKLTISKWVLIMLRSYKEKSITTSDWAKVQEYAIWYDIQN